MIDPFLRWNLRVQEALIHSKIGFDTAMPNSSPIGSISTVARCFILVKSGPICSSMMAPLTVPPSTDLR